MSTHKDFQCAIHTEKFWKADEVDREAFFSQYTIANQSEVTAAQAYQLGMAVVEEMQRFGLIVKALALEKQTIEPKRRGRPPKAKPNFLAVVGEETSKAISYESTILSPEEARALGEKLIQAAMEMEGSFNGHVIEASEMQDGTH